MTETFWYNLATGMQWSQAFGYLAVCLVMLYAARIFWVRLRNDEEPRRLYAALCGFSAFLSVLCVSEAADQVWWSIARETAHPERLGQWFIAQGWDKWDFENSHAVLVIKGATAFFRWLTLAPLVFLMGMGFRQMVFLCLIIMALNAVGVILYAQ